MTPIRFFFRILSLFLSLALTLPPQVRADTVRSTAMGEQRGGLEEQFENLRGA